MLLKEKPLKSHVFIHRFTSLQKKTFNRGFTLLELGVVILIISIVTLFSLPGIFSVLAHEKNRREVHHIVSQIHLTRTAAIRMRRVQQLCFKHGAHLGFHHPCLRFNPMGFLMGEQGSIYRCEKSGACYRIIVSMSGRTRVFYDKNSNSFSFKNSKSGL